MPKVRHTLTAKCFDKRGRLLSEAVNRYDKTHPVQAYFAKKVGHASKIYLHAEIHAILKAGGKEIHRIEISRYSKVGNQLLAKPCPVCMEAIRAYGIKEVSWSIDV